MANKKDNCFVNEEVYGIDNKAPYDDKVISRKNEVVIFPKIFPNKCEDININEKIKNYKKELKKELKINHKLEKQNHLEKQNNTRKDKLKEEKKSQKSVYLVSLKILSKISIGRFNALS